VNIYDIQGSLVAQIDHGFKQKGLYTIEWDGNDLPAGLYFCRIVSGDQSRTLKISKL